MTMTMTQMETLSTHMNVPVRDVQPDDVIYLGDIPFYVNAVRDASHDMTELFVVGLSEDRHAEPLTLQMQGSQIVTVWGP